MPNLASPRRALGGSQGGGAIFVRDINGCQRLAAAQQFALHRVLRAGHEYKGALAAIAIRRVVIAMQCHLAAGGDGGKGGPAAGPVGSGRVRCRRGGFRGRRRGESCAHRSRRRRGLRPAAPSAQSAALARPAAVGTSSDAAHAASAALQRHAGSVHAAALRVRLFLYARSSTALLPGIATEGETMEVNGIAHIFLTASNLRTLPRILS